MHSARFHTKVEYKFNDKPSVHYLESTSIEQLMAMIDFLKAQYADAKFSPPQVTMDAEDYRRLAECYKNYHGHVYGDIK